ncbi:MAG: L-threonylcarbamoyladenylate synthase [Spirochaetaceae bacterium]|jgi:tRNA threonylcarbamoyl adenosine modification protein (Sua5/YciO/YrdC/YwlC family)|nr:L-threonylcarbamoyladenylate synthase [Spirochaetaceae bacterium]
MIETIVPGNMDDRLLDRGAQMLMEGGLVALPTDTSWSISCSFRSSEGIKRLRSLSGEREERHFTLLCSSIAQFGEWCQMDTTRFRLINRLTPGPYVFILKTLRGTEKALGLRRKELGVRIPQHPVALGITRALGLPLYSITAKRSMIPGFNTELSVVEDPPLALPPIPETELFQEAWELEGIAGLDLILDSGEEQRRTFSTILDLSGEAVTLLRQGAGIWPV